MSASPFIALTPSRGALALAWPEAMLELPAVQLIDTAARGLASRTRAALDGPECATHARRHRIHTGASLAESDRSATFMMHSMGFIECSSTSLFQTAVFHS